MESEDKDGSESKRSKRKSEKNKELSAAEKFNNFKKQRTENKEGDIVDDLFKDFIAKKMKEIDCERGIGAGQSEASELNKFLDKEIKHINVPPPAGETNGESLVTVKEEPIDTEDEPLLPPLNRERRDSESETIAPVVPIKTEAKKQVIGFKNFGIKLSLTSTELIKSGDVHKKGKRLEEGEVLSSEKSDDSDSSSDGEADDDDGDAGEVSGTGSISDTDKDKSKKKKRKKKLKHKKKKKHKEKEKEKEKVKEEENNDQNVLVVKEEKNSSKRKVSITPKSRSKSPSKKHKKSRSRSKERRKKSRSRSGSRSKDRRKRSRSRSKDRRKRSRSKDRRKRSRSRSKDRRKRSRSKSKDRSRSKHKRSRSRERRKRSRSRSKHRRSRSGSRSRRRSPSPPPDPFWRSRYGNFDAHMFMKRERERERRHGRSRSRSKTPDRERDRFLAKEKKRMEDLRLKIDKAKLREIAIKNAVEMAKSGGGPQVDVTFKSGGKSVEELTDFCKRISSKDERRSHYPDSSSDEEVTQRPATDDEDDLIHHPFKVKEAPIVMDIKNAKQLPNVTPAERLAQTGVLRLQFPVSSGSQHREKEWVPVEKPNPQAVTATAPQGAGDPAAAAAPPPEVKVFEDPPPEPMDISSIIAERLSAVRKLAENPHDMSAKTVLTAAQKKASQWANARNLPGQFIGSTGANIMTQEELIGPDKKRQAWLKKDVFTNAAPVKSGIGMFLLQRMGWKQGEGLGKNNEGRVDPLLLDVKTDRKGLVTIGEGKKGGGGGGGAAAPRVPAIKDLSGKHPVSALVEFCNKRRFGSPQFEVIHESGPDHKKNFLFKVKVNGTEYQPSIASNNKKLAKAQAATVVLQEFGLVPRTVAV